MKSETIAEQIRRHAHDAGMSGEDQARRLAEDMPEWDLRALCEFIYLATQKFQVDPISCYTPHPKQAAFHNADARFRLFLGGNRSGKTHCSVIELLSHALGFRFWKIPNATYSQPFIANPDRVPIEARVTNSRGRILRPPTHGLCVADGFDNGILGIIVPKLQEWGSPYIKEWHKGASGTLNMVEFVNGSTCKFASYDQAAKKFEGPSYHYVLFDEPPPEEIWVACRRGMVDHSARAWFTLTPLREPWLFDRIYMRAVEGDANYWTISASFFDNPFRERDVEFLDDLTEEEAEARIHGRFIHLQGRIYKTWSRDLHVIDDREIPPTWPRFQVVDPHNVKPWATIWAAIGPGDTIEIYQEWPIKPLEKISRVSMTYDDYASLYRSMEGWTEQTPEKAEVYWRIMDPNFGRTRAVGNQRTVAEEMAERGFFYDTSVNDDIDSGHFKVMSYLRPNADGKPQLLVHRSCRNTIVSMERYTQDPNAKETVRSTIRPHPKWKDIPDCIRYLCMFEPTFEPIQPFSYVGEQPQEPMLYPGVT